MKKFFVITAVVIMTLTACEKEALNESAVTNQESEPTEVTRGTARRAATSVAEVVTRLDVWIYESGTEVAAVHQSSSDDDFGSISLTLNKTKTYTLYAVGHRAGGAATLADGIITFPDDKVTHSMYYTETFSPATKTSLSCLMNRIVAQFNFNTTDQCPASATKMTFTISNVYDRWSITDGATHQVDRVSMFNNFEARNNGTVGFNVYAIVTNAQTLHTVTVTAYDANDQELQSRTFTDVPLRNGYKTAYLGVFFTDTPTAGAFTIGDWNEYDVVEF